MFRSTTASFTFVLPIQTSTCTEILLTYKQCEKELDKHYENGTLPEGMTLNKNEVIQQLTQEETKLFDEGIVAAQIRVLTNQGKSHSSQVFYIKWSDVLNDLVLS